MDSTARLTSKGHLTVTRAVRDALPHFLELAATIEVPTAKRNVAWDEVIRRNRAVRASRSR